MSNRNRRLGIALAAALIPAEVAAQHDAHQSASPQAPSSELTQCARVQPIIENIIAAAMSRAEAARLSNNPTELRAAVEHLEAALRDIRAQSTSCSTAAASTDSHAGHTMPMQPPSSAPTAAPADGVVSHAGHNAPSAAKERDPVTGVMVDPETAPKTTYQGQTYYFSSEQSRKQFLDDPVKFAKKPKN
jgi:YHS domain-containing protein